MQVRLFLRTTSLITSLLGLVLIFFPGFIESTFVTHPSHGGDIFIRFLGSTLYGYAWLNWFTAKWNHLDSTRATLAANLITLTIAFVISLVAVVDGTLNKKGLLIVLLHLTFALGFATLLIKDKQKLS